MAVTSEVTLPAQPAAGAVTYQPLGGDGFTAPLAAMTFNVQLTHDASGGSAEISVRPDPQWVSVLNYTQVGVIGATVDTPVALTFDSGHETFTIPVNLPEALAGGSLVSNAALWTPPLVLLDVHPGADPVIKYSLTNTNGDTSIMNGRFYCFRKGVAQRVPLNVLVSALPRASTLVVSPNI